MTGRSHSEWITLIEDTAHGRVAWNNKADCSPWDGFYRDYRAASLSCRQEIDAAFSDCLDSVDPRLMNEAIIHPFLSAQVAVPRLMRLLAERREFLLAHRYWDTDMSLLARALNALASRAGAPDLDESLREQVRDTILHWVPSAGPLGASLGTFFGDLGPEAADALVAVLPAGQDHTRLMMEAGYALHRSPERWRRVMELAARWPPVLLEALQRGGADHAARFPAD